MTKEELKHTSEEIKYRLSDLGVQIGNIAIEYIKELEEKISVLLSCKNCPENKGGYICQKEYEDKCLTQKIQYIKELQEENADLEAQIEKMKCCGNCKHRDDMTSYCKKHKKEIYIFMVDSKCNDWELFD